MSNFNTEEPDVELRDFGCVEVRFNTQKAKEWASTHHIMNQSGDNDSHTSSGMQYNPIEADKIYKCRIAKFEASGLAERMTHSGLNVIRDPKLSGSEELRWINTY